jgi:hypothetical protein
MYCDAKIEMVPFCTSCGKPTEWATHDQRVEYELRQWGSTPRAAAKTRKNAPVVSLREVAEATANVPSPLVRSTVTAREAKNVRKVALHPMAAKVRRARAETSHEAPALAVNDDILPAPRSKKMSIKRHDRHPVAPVEMPETATVASEPKPARRKPAAKADAKPSVNKATAPVKKARGSKEKKTPTLAEKIATTPAARRPAKRAPLKKPAPSKADVVIDLTEPRADADGQTQMIALMERQVELLSEVVRQLSALEEKNAPARTNGNGKKSRRFWFAKR